VAEAQTVPVVEPVAPVVEPVVMAPERPEGSGMVASSTALGEDGTSGRTAAVSEGNLRAGSSGPPVGGASWAVVQRGVPEDFICAEREEEEIWLE
jgi:hypothetical protein